MNWNNVSGCALFRVGGVVLVCLCADLFSSTCCAATTLSQLTDHKMNAALDSMIGSNRTKLDEMQRVIMKQRQQISDTRR